MSVAILSMIITSDAVPKKCMQAGDKKQLHYKSWPKEQQAQSELLKFDGDVNNN